MGAKRYSQEFKDEAVKLVLENWTAVRQAARELGISEFTLRDWIKKAQPNNHKLSLPKTPSVSIATRDLAGRHHDVGDSPPTIGLRHRQHKRSIPSA